MVPVNVWSAVFFLVLVAPGLLHDLMTETRIARQKESAFREISRVVLASLAFSAVPLLVITVIGANGWSNWLPDPSRWARSGNAYVVNNYAAVAFSLVLQCVASCALVWGVHLLQHGKKPKLVAEPTWRKVFREDNPTDNAPIVRVKTASGTTFVGELADYSQTWDEDRDLVLGPPLQVKRESEKIVDMPPNWQRIIIPSASIQTIAVRYQPDPDTPRDLDADLDVVRKVDGAVAPGLPARPAP